VDTRNGIFVANQLDLQMYFGTIRYFSPPKSRVNHSFVAYSLNVQNQYCTMRVLHRIQSECLL
jgi:hypothetical protein